MSEIDPAVAALLKDGFTPESARAVVNAIRLILSERPQPSAPESPGNGVDCARCGKELEGHSELRSGLCDACREERDVLAEKHGLPWRARAPERPVEKCLCIQRGVAGLEQRDPSCPIHDSGPAPRSLPDCACGHPAAAHRPEGSCVVFAGLPCICGEYRAKGEGDQSATSERTEAPAEAASEGSEFDARTLYVHAGAPLSKVQPESDAKRGLYRKYEVRRLNDPGGKHADCDYYVLDLVHDKFAADALEAYAAACEKEIPLLAKDLRHQAASVRALFPDAGRASLAKRNALLEAFVEWVHLNYGQHWAPLETRITQLKRELSAGGTKGTGT